MTEPTENQLKAALRMAQATGSVGAKTKLKQLRDRKTYWPKQELLLKVEIDRYLRA